MAGIWNKSGQQESDLNGKPIVKAKAFFYLGGTTTPIEVFRDYSLTNPHPNPLEADGYGRWPSVFMDEADGFYDFRLTSPGGSLLYTATQVPIIGPVGSGGDTPVAPIDPDGVATTGDMKARYGTGFLSGWVRANARTIGSATSGASERAADDCQNLYLWLWSEDPTLVVLGGRGGSAAADWAANKPLTLPDYRGRTFVGLDTMGNTAAGVIPAATAVGWGDGEASHKLTIEEMPSHNHTGVTGSSGGDSINVPFDFEGLNVGGGGALVARPGNTSVGQPAHTHTIPSQGGGANHNNLQPSRASTIYIRL